MNETPITAKEELDHMREVLAPERTLYEALHAAWKEREKGQA